MCYPRSILERKTRDMMFNDPEFLKLAIGAVTALIGAVWTAFVYFDKRGQKGDGSGDKPGPSHSTMIINTLPSGAVSC